MIINAEISNSRVQNYSNNTTPIKNNNQLYNYNNNLISITHGEKNFKNHRQISFGGFWGDLFDGFSVLKWLAEDVIEAVGDKIQDIKDLGSKMVKNLFTYKTELGTSSENARKDVAVDILKDVGEKISTIIVKNPHASPSDIVKTYGTKLERVLIPLKGDGNEEGLNKIIGLVKLKTKFYDDVLMPLCEVMDGKNKHADVKTGINFFGPKGTGKTYFAEQLGEHYVNKGGYFKKIKFTNDITKDTAILDRAYDEAEKKFIESGRKKYTMIFIDEVEKYLGKDNALQARTAKLLTLANNGKDRGVILVTTANYLNRIKPALLRNGRTDIRVPVGHIAEYDLADIINYYIRKDGLPVEEKIDFQKIIDAVKTEKLQYKPKDIENRLNAASLDYADYGGTLGTEEIKDALISAKPKFDSEESIQFTKDKAYANRKAIGGIYKY